MSFISSKECIIPKAQRQKNPSYLFIKLFPYLAEAGGWIIAPLLEAVTFIYRKVLCPLVMMSLVLKKKNSLIKIKLLSMIM